MCCADSAGSSADAFALLERFEVKLKDYPANVPRAGDGIGERMANWIEPCESSKHCWR